MTKWIKIFLVLISLIVFFSHANAYWVLNDPPPGCVGCDNITPESDEPLIQGASFLLQSYSDYLMLLNESELSPIKGFDLPRVETLARTALEKLETAQFYYQKSIQILATRKFDGESIRRLKDFDYDGFRANQNLHTDTMGRVAFYLSSGDVVGTYEAAYSDIGKMIDSLYPILWNIRVGSSPQLPQLRKVYKQYSDLMQFGYYASLVFAEIRK